MRLLRDATLVILTLAGAVGFSQVPRFVQEYEQRLGGALQEARRQLDRYEVLALGEAGTVESLSRRLAASADPAVAGLGRAIDEQATRTAELAAHAEALAGAGRFRKPILLLRHHDRELLAATWAKYDYTLTLDVAFAAAGALAGLVLNAAVWGIATWPRRRRAEAQQVLR
jgi:hypothetical protein